MLAKDHRRQPCEPAKNPQNPKPWVDHEGRRVILHVEYRDQSIFLSDGGPGGGKKLVRHTLLSWAPYNSEMQSMSAFIAAVLSCTVCPLHMSHQGYLAVLRDRSLHNQTDDLPPYAAGLAECLSSALTQFLFGLRSRALLGGWSMQADLLKIVTIERVVDMFLFSAVSSERMHSDISRARECINIVGQAVAVIVCRRVSELPHDIQAIVVHRAVG